jgi:hypothetical protein
MRRVDRNEEREHEQQRHAGRYLRMYTDEDGMVVVSARLSPEAVAALLRAVEAGVESLYGRSRREEVYESAGAGAVHEDGFRVELLASGEASFYRPNGRQLVDAPRVSVSGAEAALGPRLAAGGVVVAAESTLPSWDGGEVDYGWEIDWLRSLDRGRPQPPVLSPSAKPSVSSALA